MVVANCDSVEPITVLLPSSTDAEIIFVDWDILVSVLVNIPFSSDVRFPPTSTPLSFRVILLFFRVFPLTVTVSPGIVDHFSGVVIEIDSTVPVAVDPIASSIRIDIDPTASATASVTLRV